MSPTIVHYDVADDRRRAGVAAALRPIAAREQQSLWIVAPVPRVGPERLAGGLSALLGRGDRLLVHRPCSECIRSVRSVPAEPRPMDWFRPQIVAG